MSYALLISFALLGLTVYLFMLVPKGFLPSEDQGRFNISTEGVQGLGFAEMVRHQQAIAAIVAADPNVQAFSSNVAFNGGGSNQGVHPGQQVVPAPWRSIRSACSAPISSAVACSSCRGPVQQDRRVVQHLGNALRPPRAH